VARKQKIGAKNINTKERRNTMTTKLTIENLNYKNVKQSIKEWSKEEAVKLAIFSAELVIDSYDGDSDAPREAIQAAKNWLKNQTARDSFTAADDNDEVKQKIADYINNKNDGLSAKALDESKEPEQVEWKSGDECTYINESGERFGAIVIGWHPEHPGLIIETFVGMLLKVTMEDIEKPKHTETPEQKKERARLENGKSFYKVMSKIEISVMNEEDHGTPNPWEELAEEWQEVYILQAEHLGYRKTE
jgi:hypothetical protein